MIDLLRTIVSGKKRRFINDQYNLDLTYITSNIIAMSFPASGIYSLYRNDIESVSNFMKENHTDKYLIINLSGYKYDTSYFNDNVLEFEWKDHHPPRLFTLFKIVSEMKKFLIIDYSNTIAIHCLAGKGRTGTIICCYLLFVNIFNNVNDCLKYYSSKRFEEGDAITHPGQKRYINYFFRILNEKINFPLRKRLTSIKVKHIPSKEKSGTIYPYIEIIDENRNDILFTNISLSSSEYSFKYSEEITLTNKNFSLGIKGDITINIYSKLYLKNKLIGRVSFNTAFLKVNQTELVFKIDEIDPDSLQKKKNINKDYQIILEFHNECECDNLNIEKGLCKECKYELNYEILDWENMKLIKEVRSYIFIYFLYKYIEKISELLYK